MKRRWNYSGSILFGAEPVDPQQVTKARKRAVKLGEPAEVWLLERTEPFPCGTYAAAKRHVYHGEPLCDACVEAEAVRNRHKWRRVTVASRRARGLADWTRPPGVTLGLGR